MIKQPIVEPVAPVANYVPFVRTGNFMVVSGQLCLDAEGKLVAKGQLGGGVSIDDGVNYLTDLLKADALINGISVWEAIGGGDTIRIDNGKWVLAK